MTGRLSFWFSLIVASGLLLAMSGSAARAQIGPLQAPNEDTQASEASLEANEAREKIEDLRARLAEWQAQSTEYLQAAEEAETRAHAIDRDVELLQRRELIEVSEAATASELRAQRVTAEQDLAAARQEAVELSTQAEQRLDRRRKLPELLSLAKEKLAELDEAQPPTSANPKVADALRELHATRRAVLQAEITAYQNELSSYDARGVLLGKRHDRASLRVAFYETLVQRLREAEQRLERQRIKSRNEATERLLRELTAVPDGVKQTLDELHQRNEALASLLTDEGGLYDQIDDVSEKLSRAEDKVAEIEAELTRLAARVEAVGLADSVGVLLRRHRAEAPDIGMYRRFIRMRQEKIGSVQLQQIRLREQREALADIDGLVNEAMASIEGPISSEQRAEIESLLRQLFETQREYMDALIEDYETYFQKLVDFDASQQELINRTKDLLDFIDERILWIPSGKAVQPDLGADARDAAAWLFGPTYWAQLATAARDAASRLWPLHLLALLLAIVFVPARRRLGARIRSLGDQARQPKCLRFAPTATALGQSLLLAIWLPALLAYVAWRVGLSPQATQFTRSFTHGLLMTAAYWATLRIARQLVRPNGVAEAHCDWPEQAAHALWRDLRWLALVTVPAVFLIFVFEARGEDVWRETIGRFAFLLCMGAILVFNHLALRTGGPLAAVFRRRDLNRPWVRRTVQLAGWLVPLGLAVAALRGFYWTALQFSVRLHFTLGYLFLLVLAVQLIARWSMIAGRRALVEEDGALEDKKTEEPPTMEVSRLMIGTAVLLAILGSFAIWADLLPATRILDQVELWKVTRTVTVSEIDPSGAESFSTEDRLVAITLSDLFRSFLIGLLTLALIRALPGLLEASLLRRLGPGERYAYATIVKYTVALVGLAFAFDALGVGWSSIQWLVAAIGLGLGFGLQEIFANFVSGLIILFERPIRVGDVVSVGDVSGTVTKIRIRATWITAFDRKELIVPNKTFVTGELINWTLTDSILRLEIPVGIAYGSDTERAIEVLKKVARESSRVLHDPSPQVYFLGFGDSSLTFELWVFARGVTQRFMARHEIHMAIDKAFREAGIEIAFPQRDLHLRSLPKDWKVPSSPELPE